MKTSKQFRSHISVFLGFGLPFFLFVFWDLCLAWAMIFRLQMNDFGKFYHSIVAFLNNKEMYEPNIITLGNIGDNYAQHFLNLNPPHFHLPLLPLGFLSQGLAMTIWGLASFMALFAGLHWIGNELNLELTPWQMRLAVLGFLAFAGTGSLLLTGQLSFLLFLPVTLAWIHARHGRWGKTGFYLGLASSIKPFLLLFIPYFLLQRQFKTVWIILAVIITNFSIGLTVFGLDPHLAWIQCLMNVDWAWPPMNASILGTLTRNLTETPLYGVKIHLENALFIPWILMSGIIATIALFTSTLDASPVSIDRAFVILILSAFLISPLGWIYYFFLLLGPLTALITHWWHQYGQKPQQWKPNNHYGLRNFLFLLSIPGFLIPQHATLWLQPNALAALTIGSAYFWSTLVLWISLIMDWRLENPQCRPSDFFSTLSFGNHVKAHREADYV